MTRDDLTVEVVRLLGFARTGKDLATAIGVAIDEISAGQVEVDHLARIRRRGQI